MRAYTLRIEIINQLIPRGIRMGSVLYSVSAFIFAASLAACAGRKTLPQEQQFGVELQLSMTVSGQ